MKKITLTKKEIELLHKITKSDYQDWVIYNDGTSGVGDYISESYYDMKITRGLITSLNKKGVLDLGKSEKGFDGKSMIWVSINPDYLDLPNYKLIEVACYESPRKEKNKKQTVHDNRHIDCILNVTDGHMQNIITIFQNNAKDHAMAFAEGKVHPEAKKNAIEFYDDEFPLNSNDHYQMIKKADTPYSRMILNYLDSLFFFVFDELLPIYKAKKEEVGSVYEYNSKYDNETPVFGVR